MQYQLINGDCLIEMAKIPKGTINAILTDPPYKYLSNQELENDYDEDIFVRECHRVLDDNGMLLVFGRGTSFDRLKLKLANYIGLLYTHDNEIYCNLYEAQTEIERLGLQVLLDKGYKAEYLKKKERFVFKESLVWDKSYNSSPVLPISRVHEDLAIFGKGGAKVIKAKVPYLEMKHLDFESIYQDVKRIKSALGNPKSLAKMLEYLENNRLVFENNRINGHATVSASQVMSAEQEVYILHQIKN